MKLFDTRNEMIKYYSSQIENPIMCEIGVFKGEFFKYILDNCNPSILEGVDVFSGIAGSGDVDGNNPIQVDMNEVYDDLQNNFKNNLVVSFHKDFSHKYLQKQPDNKYDIIYIDADHSYNAVKRDIELAFHKIKNKGFIMGHDYELNKSKCNHNWKFGTKQAVDEFCKNYSQSICSFGNDGCVSFAIRVSK
tara:strand:+ start:2018 stop:2590 length:573 start_codon:yes stop_codon:yes gene_type:complete